MPTETTQKPYFFREKNGTITYCDTQEEMFELLRSPKGNNFCDMGKAEYLDLLSDDDQE